MKPVALIAWLGSSIDAQRTPPEPFLLPVTRHKSPLSLHPGWPRVSVNRCRLLGQAQLNDVDLMKKDLVGVAWFQKEKKENKKELRESEVKRRIKMKTTTYNPKSK